MRWFIIASSVCFTMSACCRWGTEAPGIEAIKAEIDMSQSELDERIRKLEDKVFPPAKLPEHGFHVALNLNPSTVENLVFASGKYQGQKMYGGYGQLYSTNGAFIEIGSGVLFSSHSYVTYCDENFNPIIQSDEHKLISSKLSRLSILPRNIISYNKDLQSLTPSTRVSYISGDPIEDLNDVRKWNLENPNHNAELDLIVFLEQSRYGSITSFLGVLCECEGRVYFYKIDNLTALPVIPIDMFEKCESFISGDERSTFDLRNELGYRLEDGDFVVYNREGEQQIIKSEEYLNVGEEYFALSFPSKFVKILALPNGSKCACKTNTTFEWHFEPKVEVTESDNRVSFRDQNNLFDLNGRKIDNSSNNPNILIGLHDETPYLLDKNLYFLEPGANNTLTQMRDFSSTRGAERDARFQPLRDLFAKKPVGSWIATLCNQVPNNVDGQLSQASAAPRAAASTRP